MSDEFINCHSCGTRNFRTDKNCGICQAELSPGDLPAVHKTRAIRPAPALVVTVIVICLALFFVNNREDTYDILPTSKASTSLDQLTSKEPVTYTLEEVLNKPSFCTITARLPKKITNARLEALSYNIKETADCTSGTVRIFFLLPEIQKGNGAWACAELSPTFRLKYFGPSLEKEQELRAAMNNSTYKTVGQWIDNADPGGSGEVVHRVRYNNGGDLIFEPYSVREPDREAPFPVTVKKTTRKGRTVYVNTDEDSNDEYYVVLENGDLACYDRQGLIITMKKL